MTSIKEAPCPQCGGTLVLHCANKACTWLKCLTEKCAAVVDTANRRGFARNENRDLGWVPVTFEESK